MVSNAYAETFANCKHLEFVNWSMSYIPSSTFYNCQNLSYYNFENTISIGRSAFLGAGQFSSILTLPVCTTIENDAFAGHSEIYSMNLPHCISANGFQNCTNLSSISAPECTSLGGLCKTAFTTIDLPACTNLWYC